MGSLAREKDEIVESPLSPGLGGEGEAPEPGWRRGAYFFFALGLAAAFAAFASTSVAVIR